MHTWYESAPIWIGVLIAIGTSWISWTIGKGQLANAAEQLRLQRELASNQVDTQWALAERQLKLQRELTERQILAPLRSSSRLRWVAALRDEVANFLSAATLVLAGYERAAGDVETLFTNANFSDAFQETKRAWHAITLLLNPKEPNQRRLLHEIDELSNFISYQYVISSSQFDTSRAQIIQVALEVLGENVELARLAE